MSGKLRTTMRVICLALGICLTGCWDQSEEHTDTHAPTAAINQREDLGRLKYKRDKARRSIERLEQDRQQLADRLRNSGIRSVSDLAKHPARRVEAEELKQVVMQIRQIEKTVVAYEQAIAGMEAVLRRQDRADRLKSSALSDDDLNELSRITHELEDQLHPDKEFPLVDDVELDTVLRSELER